MHHNAIWLRLGGCGLHKPLVVMMYNKDWRAKNLPIGTRKKKGKGREDGREAIYLE